MNDAEFRKVFNYAKELVGNGKDMISFVAVMEKKRVTKKFGNKRKSVWQTYVRDATPPERRRFEKTKYEKLLKKLDPEPENEDCQFNPT